MKFCIRGFLVAICSAAFGLTEARLRQDNQDETGAASRFLAFTPLTSGNIDGAVTLFFDNRTAAELEYGPIEDWDTSAVTNMGKLFEFRTFNEDISQWDVSRVTTMFKMFKDTDGFNQDLNDWDVSKVTSMFAMFQDSHEFNGPIGDWNTSSLDRANHMFYDARKFNQNIQGWDVSSVTRMHLMFRAAREFNQDLCDWDVALVSNMAAMFRDTDVFNQDLSCWDVSKVTLMVRMFEGAQVFDQDIRNWDTSSVTSMESMFEGATVFNQELCEWDVSLVTDMSGMFRDTDAFNQDIRSWDVSKVTTMERMFLNTQVFNQDIRSWDTALVTSMESMFEDAAAFNQGLLCWDTSSLLAGQTDATIFTNTTPPGNSVGCLPEVEFYSDSFEQDYGNWVSPGGKNIQFRDSHATDGNYTLFLRNTGYITTEFPTNGLRGYRVEFNSYISNMRNESISGEPKGLVLEHSEDGSSWLEAGFWNCHGYHTGNVYQLDNFGSLPFEATDLFVRLRVHGDEKDDHVHLDEIKVIGLYLPTAKCPPRPPPPLGSTSEIHSNSFEQDLGEWVAADGSADNRRRRSSSFATDGSFAVLLRRTGSISTNFTTADYSGYRISFNAYFRNLQGENISGTSTKKGLILEHSSDGSSWPTAMKLLDENGFVCNTVYQLNDFGSLNASETFYVRFRLQGEEKNDHVFLDQVVISGLLP